MSRCLVLVGFVAVGILVSLSQVGGCLEVFVPSAKAAFFWNEVVSLSPVSASPCGSLTLILNLSPVYPDSRSVFDQIYHDVI